MTQIRAQFKKQILKYILGITFIMLFPAIPATAQENALSIVSINNKEIIRTLPRKVLCTSFRIINKGLMPEEATGTLVLPENWTIVNPDTPFSLNPGLSDVRFISFFIPRKTPAGIYYIKYVLSDRATGTVIDSSTALKLT